MQIVCNSCVGAHLYNKLNIEYNNPFTWSILSVDDLIYLEDNFLNIDFNNYKMELIKPRNYVLCNVDDKISIHYIHYIESSKYDIPTRLTQPNRQRDILSKNMINTYASVKYVNRCNRINKNDRIYFVLDTFTSTTFCRKITNQDICNFINTNKSSNKIVITNNKDFLKYNSNTCKIVLTQTGNTGMNADLIKKTGFIKNT